MTNWTMYEKGLNRKSGKQTVSVYVAGTMTISRAAVEAINSDAVVFLYDDTRKLIGIRAAKPDDKNAFSMKAREGQTARNVSARGFLRYHGLTVDKPTTCPARMEGDVLTFSLDKGGG